MYIITNSELLNTLQLFSAKKYIFIINNSNRDIFKIKYYLYILVCILSK
jgi:hypothetical protein